MPMSSTSPSVSGALAAPGVTVLPAVVTFKVGSPKARWVKGAKMAALVPMKKYCFPA